MTLSQPINAAPLSLISINIGRNIMNNLGDLLALINMFDIVFLQENNTGTNKEEDHKKSSRAILSPLNLHKKILLLINVYAPANGETAREEFFTKLGQLDIKNSDTLHKEPNALISIMDTFRLEDRYRIKHPRR